MHRPKSPKWFIACLCALTATLALSPVAVASPQEVIADWNVDGFIQGHYSIGDLRNAPLLMQRLDPARVGSFLVVVNEKIDQDVLGIQTPAATQRPVVHAAGRRPAHLVRRQRDRGGAARRGRYRIGDLPTHPPQRDPVAQLAGRVPKRARKR